MGDRTGRLWWCLIGAAALALGLAAPGCQLAGGMLASYERTGSHSVKAEYTGLEGKRFAVLVAADRMIQANHPQLVAQVTTAVTARLVTEIEHGGFVPPQAILQFQYDRPRWTAMGYSDLAAELGVERLVFVDLYEFRLNEPGNMYLWDGLAAAMVGVVETDGFMADEFIYTKEISVGFPDGQGFGPQEFTAPQISAVLRSRLVDRASWLFYDHKEPNDKKY
ncbi:MAG: hypothetical protein EA376_13165 [Phycisphaeraceae bacterium]|nr:MAG: hypothetical protein EA376_13165 [Phycisphaeraceae bacterium]